MAEAIKIKLKNLFPVRGRDLTIRTLGATPKEMASDKVSKTTPNSLSARMARATAPSSKSAKAATSNRPTPSGKNVEISWVKRDALKITNRPHERPKAVMILGMK